MPFLVEQLDFVYLLYGLSFLILALSAYSMARARDASVPWKFLAMFAVLQGLHEWCEMVAPAVADPVLFRLFRCVLLVSSFAFLFEFSLRGLDWAGRHRWAGRLLYIPLILVVGLGFSRGVAEGVIAARQAMALPGGILGALALWRAGRPDDGHARRLRAVAGPCAMAAYAVFVGAFSEPGSVWPSTVFNTEQFLVVTGVPIEVWRLLTALLLTASIWREHAAWRKTHYSSYSLWRSWRIETVTGAILGGVIVMGWGLTRSMEKAQRAEHEQHFVHMAQGLAAVMDSKAIAGFKGKLGVIDRGGCAELRQDARRLCAMNPEIQSVKLVGVRSGNLVILMDVNGRCDKEFELESGMVWRGAPQDLGKACRGNTSLVWRGNWSLGNAQLSVFVPVTDSARQVVAVLGLMACPANWAKRMLFARLLPLAITALVLLLVLAYAAMWRRSTESAEIRNILATRVQHQQAALLRVAASRQLAEGDEFMTFRSITEDCAKTLGVDWAAIWKRGGDNGRYRVESLYDHRREMHSAGRDLQVNGETACLEALETGRAVATNDCLDDPRFEGLRGLLGEVGARAVVIAPFRVGGSVAGVLVTAEAGRIRSWLPDEVRFVGEMADQVAHVLANADRRKSEAALRQAHGELEIRVAERTAELSRKNDELERSMAERRHLEAQVLQTQKLESLGMMAGGIAHDFNNILTAIRGNVEMAKGEVPPVSTLADYLEDIDKAAERAATLARQMLAYSGRGRLAVESIDLNHLVRELGGMLEVSVGKKTQLEYVLEDALPTVDGDSTQLGQIVMNLVINAAEAVGNEGGLVAIRTGAVWCDSRMFTSMWLKEELPEGRYSFVEVSDSGCGMDKKTLERIFDPFFTTKFTGRGLGLAAVLGIVRGHHGAIDVSSQPGRGTTFRVLFPEGRLKPAVPEPPGGAEAVFESRGLILLVDDEEPVRILGRRVLERIGFEVILAQDGLEAVEMFKQHKDRIRCVLMDLMMPKLDGQEALVALRAIDPGVKVILCSGYNEEDVVARFAEGQISGFLQKPYDVATLSARIRTALTTSTVPHASAG